MTTSHGWLGIVLIGLSLGLGGRLWIDSWDRSHRPHGGAATEAPADHADFSQLSLPDDPATAITPAAAAQPLESTESVLAAEGFEQAERLGRFLRTATSDELKRLLLGMRKSGGHIEMTQRDAIFLRWMAIDAEGALAFTEKDAFIGPAWWAWGKVDPDAALAAALAKRESWLGTMVVRAIAQDDPARARAILERHPQFAEQSAMGGMASGLMKVDPVAGATLAAAWNHSLDPEHLVSGWARREADAALAWAQALPDQARRSEALGIVLAQWAATHPEKVGPAIEAMPDGRTKWKLYAEHTRSLAATATQWAAESPQVAADWAATLPPGEARAWAAANVAGQWQLYDEAAARAWIESLPPDERRIAEQGFGGSESGR
ncbi:MAG: hypothetical protein ACKV19_22395 [Verrucomicrobiales bacterium]